GRKDHEPNQGTRENSSHFSFRPFSPRTGYKGMAWHVGATGTPRARTCIPHPFVEEFVNSARRPRKDFGALMTISKSTRVESRRVRMRNSPSHPRGVPARSTERRNALPRRAQVESSRRISSDSLFSVRDLPTASRERRNAPSRTRNMLERAE